MESTVYREVIIKKTQRRNTPRPWARSPDRVKMSVLPKEIYGVNVVQSNLSRVFFVFFFMEFDKVILKCVWKN